MKNIVLSILKIAKTKTIIDLIMNVLVSLSRRTSNEIDDKVVEIVGAILYRCVGCNCVAEIEEIKEVVEADLCESGESRVFSTEVVSDWSAYKYFKSSEFLCRCGTCDQVYVSRELVDKLELAREVAGIPFKISSGCRCASHNASEGGSSNSDHLVNYDNLVCVGVDIAISSPRDMTRYKIVRALQYAGFTRFKLSRPSIVHVGLGYRNGKEMIVQ